MQLKDLSKRIKEYANGKSVDNAVMAWIRENPHILMDYQMRQLFHMSVDRNENPLGYYGYNTATMIGPSGKDQSHKSANVPFTMQDTGDFFNKMEIKVGSKYITITSRTPHLASMQTNKFFDSVDFFGLTPQNERLFKSRISKYAAEWITTGIATGNPTGSDPGL